MSYESRAYFVQDNGVQVHIATIDIGCLPEDVNNMFVEVTPKDFVDFYACHRQAERKGHISHRTRDMYGDRLTVANLKDVRAKVEHITDWVDDGQLFKDMVISLSKSSTRNILVFIEHY